LAQKASSFIKCPEEITRVRSFCRATECSCDQPDITKAEFVLLTGRSFLAECSVNDIDTVNSEIKDKKAKGRMSLLRRCGG
jgi:hypothetical protein